MKKLFKNLLFLTVIIGVSLFIVSQTESVYAGYETYITNNISPKEKAASQKSIYFDEDGKFIFCTYDRIATSNVVYKTVGWVIKKYDEPVGVAGQISAVIPMPNYSYMIIDKENLGYRYSYFVMDGEQVLDYIYNISQAWGDYLKKYGGTVYLDSVMTVSEKGVPKGGVDSAGKGYGEVYIDYEGISTARGWADPQCLRAYFNIPVAFPPVLEKPDIQIPKDSIKTTKIVIGSSAIAGITLGSHERGYEEYDISLGIPSGEDIYAYGMADKYYAEGVLIKNTGVVNVPVKVITDYVLKWTDTEGKDREEKVQVSRYYYVQKSFEYYTADDFKVYELTGITIDGECIEKTSYDIDVPRLKAVTHNYGGTENHIMVTEGSIYAGEKVIYSVNSRKPDIPDENQEEFAKRSDASIKVRNDSLCVDEKAVLSGEWTDKGVYENFSLNQKEVIYKTGIIIHEGALNGQYNDLAAVYQYVCGGNIKSIPVKAGALTVHTPIVCSAGVAVPRKYNMAVKPKANQLVAGTDFSIVCKNIGTHRQIKGYGDRDYSMYMGKGYVRFPFEIVINNKKYNENTWIEVKGTLDLCYIPESVPLGNYKIEYAALAKNSGITDLSSAVEKRVMGNTANMSIEQYGAVSTVEVEVIGMIRGFSVECNEKTAYVGSRIGFNRKTPDTAYAMPLEVKETPLSCRVRVESCGIGKEAEDKLIGDISYYFIKDGEIYEADIYVCGKHDMLGKASYERVNDRVELGENDKVLVSEGVYQWEKNIEFGENLLVMPKGIKPDNEKIVNQYAFRNGNILINFDINGYSGNTWEYSYINVENFRRGYCNMWKTEGYLYDFVDKDGVKYSLTDGDSIIIEAMGGIYEDYEIVGTH